jgi:hypothetical protein
MRVGTLGSNRDEIEDVWTMAKTHSRPNMAATRQSLPRR